MEARRPAAARWHLTRQREILRAHPAIKALMGPCAWTAVPILTVAALQLAVSVLVLPLPLWAGAALGASVGAVLAHALGVAIHETAHDMVFRRRWMNRALAVIANIPMGFPGAVSFREEHLAHHRYLGAEDGRDTQAPTETELRFTGTSWWRKALWLAFGALFSRRRGVPLPRGWLALNALSTLGLWPLYLALDPTGFAYLFCSTLFAFGLSPMGIRRYAEHAGLREGQPTASYYGPFNYLAFLVGYHVEHHDFPGIAWFRLPRLRKLAAAHYDSLATVASWHGLTLRFLFDGRWSLSRYGRPPSGS